MLMLREKRALELKKKVKLQFQLDFTVNIFIALL